MIPITRQYPHSYSQATTRVSPRFCKASDRELRPFPQSYDVRSFSTTSPLHKNRPTIIHEVPKLRQLRQEIRESFRSLQIDQGRSIRARKTVGFLPTMGALHEGHLSLARAAARENDEVFVSIFVNPTQFGASEDLGSYPRTMESDMKKLEQLNSALRGNSSYRGRVTTVFAPTTSTMYPTDPPSSDPSGSGTFVLTHPLASILEGKSRPTFFRGVATVCSKLFNIVQAERVYFGQKDAQQAAVIRKVVKDLHFDTEVRVLPTEREKDGLAMSSRNVYLGERRRRAAVFLPDMLQRIRESYTAEGQRTAEELIHHSKMADAGVHTDEDRPGKKSRWELDYVSLSDPDTMEEIDRVDTGKGAIVSAAVRMLPTEDLQPDEELGEGDAATRPVRLIDNISLPPIGSPGT